MKHCPTCQTTFDGDEAFCPHDGTRLVDTPEHQPGRLTGSSLRGVVNLETFLYVDHIGERYRGRLLSDNSEARVTVYHRRFESARIDAARQMSSDIETPLPAQLLAVHSIDGNEAPVFAVEEVPKADTLRRLLDNNGPLDWESALQLTLKLAGSLQWLADRDVPHRALHPRAIHVDNPTTDPVQLGDWVTGLVSFPLPDLDSDTPADAIPVYPGYIAPEWLTGNADDVDIHTAAVYGLGAVLLDALGEPLLEPSELDGDFDLQQWLDDEGSPSFELEDAPPALPELARMMVAHNPEKRFDSPRAAVGALSSMLDGDPDEIAPPLENRNTPAFPTQRSTAPIPLPEHSDSSDAAEPSSPDTDDDTSDANRQKTEMGLPAQDVSDAGASGGGTSPGHTPRVIADDPDDSEQDDAIPKAGPSTVETNMAVATAPKSERGSASADSQADAPDDDDSNEDTTSQKETLLMGAVDVDDIDRESEAQETPETDTAATADDDSDADDSDADIETPDTDDTGDTTLRHVIDTDDTEEPDSDEDLTDETEYFDDDDAPDDIDDGESEVTDVDEDSAGDSNGQAHDADDIGDADESDDSIIVDDELQTDDVDRDVADDEHNADAPDGAETDDVDRDVADAPDGAEPDDVGKSAYENDADKEYDADAPSGDDMSIGYVTANQDSDDEQISEDWLSQSTERAWDEDLVREKKQRSALIEKLTTYGMVAAVILFVAGAYILFEGVLATEEADENDAEATTSASEDPDEEQSADDDTIRRLEDQFDRALERDEILRPRARSAHDALVELQRYADDELVEEFRQRYVEAADELSRTYEEESQLQQARDLSGTADEFSDDPELEERANEIQEEYLAAQRDEIDSETDDEEQETEATDSGNGSGDTASEEVTETDDTDSNVDDLLDSARRANEQRDFDVAREHFEEVLEHSPNHPTARAELGELAFNDAEYQTAIDHIEQALEAAPDQIDARLILGRAYYRSDDPDRAIEVWEEILERDSDHSQAQNHINHVQSSRN